MLATVRAAYYHKLASAASVAVRKLKRIRYGRSTRDTLILNSHGKARRGETTNHK